MQPAQAQSRSNTQPRKRNRLTIDQIAPIAMVLPSIIAIAVFVYGFIAWTGFTSFVKWDSIVPDWTLVGFENYVRIFTAPRFQADMRNTVVFTLLFLLGSLGLGLGLALLLDQKPKGEAIFRSIYLFPMALSFIVTGTVWSWIFSPGTLPNDPSGLNLLWQKLGLTFLQNTWSSQHTVVPGGRLFGLRTDLGVPLAMLPVVIAAVWQMSGFTMAMYLAGLRGIPDEIKEAARVDGANEFQIFRRIILPMLQPITLSAIIILGHISLKIFDLIMTMTGGGPGNATDVPGIFMYAITFKSNQYARGAAIAVIMLLLVAMLIVPYLISNMRAEKDQ